MLSFRFPPGQEVLLTFAAVTPVWLKKKIRPASEHAAELGVELEPTPQEASGEEASRQSRCGPRGSGAAGGADEDRWGGGRRTGDGRQSLSPPLTAENEGRDTHTHTHVHVYLSL